MAKDKVIKPVVWPTKEPEVPAPAPQPSADAGNAAQADTQPTFDPADEGPVYPNGVRPDSTHAFIWDQAAEAAAVIRSLIRGEGLPEGDLEGMSPRQIVAAFMSGLGIQVATKVLRLVGSEEDVRWVGLAVSEEPQVAHRVALAVLQAIRERIESGDYLEDGGPKYAQRLLESAFWRGRVARLLRPEGQSGWQLLKNADAAQIAPYISHEHPQTIALCLSQLQPTLAAGILANFPQRLQADVSYRMGTLGDVTPAVIKELEEALEVSLGEVLGGSYQVGGPKVLADVLNNTGSSVEKNVLDQMDAQDPKFAETVRNLMFTFADIARLTDREIQRVLREIAEDDLVVALKASSGEVRERFLVNLSEEARARVSQQLEQTGPVRLSDAEETQLRCVQQVRQLEKKGELTIVRGEGPSIWV